MGKREEVGDELLREEETKGDSKKGEERDVGDRTRAFEYPDQGIWLVEYNHCDMKVDGRIP